MSDELGRSVKPGIGLVQEDPIGIHHTCTTIIAFFGVQIMSIHLVKPTLTCCAMCTSPPFSSMISAMCTSPPFSSMISAMQTYR